MILENLIRKRPSTSGRVMTTMEESPQSETDGNLVTTPNVTNTALCAFDPIQNAPNACIKIKLNGIETIACDDTGSTLTLVDIRILPQELRTTMKKWNRGPLMGVQGFSFMPEGYLDNVSIETGLITTIVDGVAVLKNNIIPVLLGDSWREAAKVRMSSEKGRMCYKTFNGTEWQCIRPP